MATAPQRKNTTRSKKQLALAARKKAKERFLRTRKAESKYRTELRQIAKQVGLIVKQFAPNGVVVDVTGLNKALDKYAEAVKTWAPAAASKMLADVENRDTKAWVELGRTMGRELRKEVLTAPTGRLMRALLDEQVDLITSLPLKEAKRVHTLTLEAQQSGTRANEVAKMIMASGKVTQARANLIARTEVARTASTLVEARATFVGSNGYFWRTSEDEDVRHDHAVLNGEFISWDSPPVAGPKGQRYHAGQGPNCRCYPEPVLPDPEDI